MDELLDKIIILVSLVPPEKVRAIAVKIQQNEADKTELVLQSNIGTPLASVVAKQLVLAWKKINIAPHELALMLIVASHVYTKTTSEQSIELVLTGPTTPCVSTRRTEQALLQVINSAKRSLFLVSFVAYDVSTIVSALNAASDRSVDISILLELSQRQGGSLSYDAIDKMKILVPAAKLYAWRDKNELFSGGSVHAKVAVADAYSCFITSANLTGHAMEKNIEAGVLISGGKISKSLDDHLQALIYTNVVTLV